MTKRLIFSLLLFLGSRAASLAAQGTTPQDSVRAVEMARGQALLRADTVALSRMLADEFVEISRLGTVRTRAVNSRDIASGEPKLTSLRYDSLTVHIYGEVAVLQGIADNAGTFRGLLIRRNDQVHADLRPARRTLAGGGDAANEHAVAIATCPGPHASAPS